MLMNSTNDPEWLRKECNTTGFKESTLLQQFQDKAHDYFKIATELKYTTPDL